MVPITTVMIVLTAAMTSEFRNATVRSEMSKSSPYQRSVKPCHVVLDLLFLSLNPKRIITAIGDDSQTMTSHV